MPEPGVDSRNFAIVDKVQDYSESSRQSLLNSRYLLCEHYLKIDMFL